MVVTDDKSHTKISKEFNKEFKDEFEAEEYAISLWTKGTMFTRPKEIYIEGNYRGFSTDWYKFTMKWESGQRTVSLPKW